MLKKSFFKLNHLPVLRLVVLFFVMLVAVLSATVATIIFIRNDYLKENEKKIDLFANYLSSRYVDYETTNLMIEDLYENIMVLAAEEAFDQPINNAALTELVEKYHLTYAYYANEAGELIYYSEPPPIETNITIDETHPLYEFFISDELVMIEDIRKSIIDGNYYKFGNFKTNEGELLQLAIRAQAREEILDLLTVQSLINHLAIDEHVIYARFIDQNQIITAHNNQEHIGSFVDSQYIVNALQTGETFTLEHYHELEDTMSHCIGRPIYRDDEIIGVLNIGYEVGYMTPLYQNVALIIGSAGMITYILIIASAVYAAKTRKRLIDYLTHDDLTNLGTRRSFEVVMSKLKRQKQMSHFTYVLINIKDFSKIATLYGINFSDELIQTFSEGIMTHFKSASIYRLNQDDFFILLNNKRFNHLENFLKSCQNALSQSYTIGKITLDIDALMAVHQNINGTNDYERILSDLKATISYINDYHLDYYLSFDQTIRDSILRKETIEQALKSIIFDQKNDHYLYAVYQPQYDLKDNKLKGFELLTRLTLNNSEKISPNEFIKVAEESDLIHALGQYMLNQLIDFIHSLENPKSLMFSINASTKELMDETFASRFIQTLNEANINKNQIVIELTESAFALDVNQLFYSIKLLNQAGIQIAIDDFGTGYSSLTYLSKLPISYIKLDKSFTASVALNNKEFLIAKTIINIAKSLNAKVVAEGVENQSQLALVQSIGCHYVQGYYFSKPLSESKAKALYEHIKNETHVL